MKRSELREALAEAQVRTTRNRGELGSYGTKDSVEKRLSGLPKTKFKAQGNELALEVRVADSMRSRLVGLAGNHVIPSTNLGLWFPRTQSVHTVGMRFDLDLIWLGSNGQVLRIDASVPPRRVVCCWAARSVIEVASGMAAAHGLVNGLRLTA